MQFHIRILLYLINSAITKMVRSVDSYSRSSFSPGFNSIIMLLVAIILPKKYYLNFTLTSLHATKMMSMALFHFLAVNGMLGFLEDQLARLLLVPLIS